jgi:hypothetical protein
MKFIQAYSINEIHPGAEPMETTISRFIDGAEKRGISRTLSFAAISIYLDFLKGNGIPRIKNDSKMADALRNIEHCVNTLFEDGYPMQWIERELLRFA